MTLALVWLRQDLRLADHPALYHAATEHDQILPIYIYESEIPWALGSAQRWWLHHSLQALQQQLAQYKVPLILRRGDAADIIKNLINTVGIDAVYWNHCYEPYHIQRDEKLLHALTTMGVDVATFNASLLKEPWDTQTKQGGYFKVFTPFWKSVTRTLTPRALLPIPKLSPLTPQHEVASDNLAQWKLLPHAPDWSIGIAQTWSVSEKAAHKQLGDFLKHRINFYKTDRDRPDKPGTSRLSPYLHFGQISPWQIWHALQPLLDQQPQHTHHINCFLRELGWREFSYHLLYHFPQLPEKNFRSVFDAFTWHDDSTRLKQWREGQTGYPLVDAGMRELWHTGYMHNRVRMIVASFLTKDLLKMKRQSSVGDCRFIFNKRFANSLAVGRRMVLGYASRR